MASLNDLNESSQRGGRTVLLMLAVVLAVSCVLRFGGLDRESRWCDEYLQTSSYRLPPRYVVMFAQGQQQPPLDYLIGWALAYVDDSVWTMRAPAAFFGVVGVAFCFLLTRRMSSWREALIASTIVALSPLHLRMSQTARPYTILVAAFLITLWALHRAIEQPMWRRVLIYAAAAYVMTLTRALAPPVVMLSAGMVLTAAYGISLRRNRTAAAVDRTRSTGRVLAATVIVGLIAIPMLLFILGVAGDWTVFGDVRAPDGRPLPPGALARMQSNAMLWAAAPKTMFGAAWIAIVPLSIAGAIRCAVRWTTMPLATRCVWSVCGLSVPVYLVTFSAAVSNTPLHDRYGLYWMPVLAMLASVAVVRGFEFGRSLLAGYRPGLRRTIAACVIVLLLIPTASPAIAWRQWYFNADWQGCAAYLAKRVTGDDVVMVFQDRSLGEYQPAFWGKYEWPDDGKRPLGESMWTLATSEAHWQRLLRKAGRCYVVIKYEDVKGGLRPDEYAVRGLRQAPPGMVLKKFRGLDLLIEIEPPGDLTNAMMVACDRVLQLPMRHREAAAIPLLLRSRLQLLAGDRDGAAATYEIAQSNVPPSERVWFNRMAIQHATALAKAAHGSTSQAASFTSTAKRD